MSLSSATNFIVPATDCKERSDSITGVLDARFELHIITVSYILSASFSIDRNFRLGVRVCSCMGTRAFIEDSNTFNEVCYVTLSHFLFETKYA